MSTSLVRLSFAFAGLLLSVVGCGGSSSGGTQTSTDTSATTATATGTSTFTAKLVINELQPANQDTATDEHGDPDDWIEIYNPEATAVDLRGCAFSDSANKQIISGSLPVPAGGYVLIWADDSPAQGSAHLGFKLSAKKGDTLTLTDPNGNVVDTVTFAPAIVQNVYARFPSGTGAFAWCAQATPGLANGSACGVP